MSNPSPADDLDWLAFCYVAGELSDDEQSDWEARLSTDQRAREAVAEAVKLTTQLSAAVLPGVAPLAPARRRTAWWERLGWIAVGAAASLLLMLGWNHSANPAGRMGNGAAPPAGLSPSQSDLVRVASLLSDTADPSDLEPGESLDDDASGVEEELLFPADSDMEEAELLVPEWLPAILQTTSAMNR